MKLLICIFIFASCSSINRETLLIERNLDAKSCADYFSVSSSLESNAKLRETLQEYLYKGLVDVYECDLDSTSLALLYKRDSFKNSILLFYTDSAYESLSHFEYSERFREGYANLLFNCQNIDVKYLIVDSLLSMNISSGLLAVWNSAKLHKLHHLDSYVEKSLKEKSTYKCAELAVIFHNSKAFERRNELVEFIKRQHSSRDLAEKLERLFGQNVVIDHERYVLEVFGGH